MNWNDFTRDVHQTAVDKGWWDKPVSFDDVICMCICELAEAVEEYRSGRPNLYHLCVASGDKRNPCDWDLGKPCPLATGELTCEHRDPKPEGVAVELADCVLRLLDYLATTDVDIDRSYEVGAQISTDGDMDGSVIKVALDSAECLLTARRINPSSEFDTIRHNGLMAVVIYINLWAESNRIDLESILRSKHEYNKTRPYRHGGKVL